MSEWISMEERLPDCEYVVVFSPDYPEGTAMRYRIMEARFVPLCREATHWMPLPEPPQ